jgi:hypothetical protein
MLFSPLFLRRRTLRLRATHMYIYISTVAKYVHSGVVYCLMECGHAFSCIHACETTVTPAHDEPLEEQAARAQTNSGYARNGTLFPQVYRVAAPPFASKKFTLHGFFLGNMACDSGLLEVK